jgi:inosine/xanthosine triphosphate pyrophosphatase family protein
MSDKLDELSSEIDDAVLTTEELQNEPGDLSEKGLGEVKDALDKVHTVVEDLEDASD